MVLLLEPLSNIDRIGWVPWNCFHFSGDHDYIVNFIYARSWVTAIVCVYSTHIIHRKQIGISICDSWG